MKPVEFEVSIELDELQKCISSANGFIADHGLLKSGDTTTGKL